LKIMQLYEYCAFSLMPSNTLLFPAFTPFCITTAGV